MRMQFVLNPCTYVCNLAKLIDWFFTTTVDMKNGQKLSDSTDYP